MKKNKKQIKELIPFILIGFVIGIFSGLLMTSNLMEEIAININTSILMADLLSLIFFIVAYIIQLIVHEFGHLLFGLLSHYSFVSFRVDKFILLKENNHFKIKKYSLAGTGGQCLMNPPDKDENGNYPYILYNLGGVILNALSTIISIVLLFSIQNGYIRLINIGMTMAGLVCFFTNGIPLKTAQIANDGYNALSLGKDKDALNAMWCQLKVASLQTQGYRLKDMPDEYFKLNENADLHNILVSSILVFNENRAMDNHNFELAYSLINKLLSDECDVVGLYKTLLLIDKTYLDILKNNEVDLSFLKENAHMSIIKGMSKNPSIIRTNYAIAKKIDCDETKAAQHLKAMNELRLTYPYKQDIESEIEILKILDEKILNNE